MGPRRLSLLLCLATSAFAQSGVISGTVVDSLKIPIAGANMYLTIEMGGCPSTVATTDNNGRFQFPNAQPGRYRVKAAKVGYITQEFGEKQRRTPGFGANIILTPSAPSADVEIVLPRGSQISGTVLDEQGRPLARGYVFFQNPEVTSQSFHALTDGTGHYYVTDLPPGQYHVSARRFSEQANQVVGDLWFYPGTTDKNLAALVPLGDNATVADIHFGGFNRAPGVVRVHTEQGIPVARAEVVIRRQGSSPTSWEHIDTLRTGADGRAEIRTLPPGEYCAYVSKLPPPLASWRNQLAEATSLDRYAKQFRVASGQTDVSIDFAVAAGIELSGRFRMKDGSAPPAHTISLDLLSSPGNMSFLVKPAKLDHESFVFQGMSAGEPYTLREFQNDHLKPFVIVQILINGASLRGDDIIVPAQNLEIILDHSAVISGYMKSASTVAAKRIDGDAPTALHPPVIKTEVVNGRFVFRGLPPGTYLIAGTQQVEVKSGETIELTL